MSRATLSQLATLEAELAHLKGKLFEVTEINEQQALTIIRLAGERDDAKKSAESARESNEYRGNESAKLGKELENVALICDGIPGVMGRNKETTYGTEAIPLSARVASMVYVLLKG
jgi:hypothetical protein